jgi:hypothetical protein|tara:strand:+ start:9566 stop:9862 length:297 start_codon:yes stop_codon:yes gene_type:complete
MQRGKFRKTIPREGRSLDVPEMLVGCEDGDSGAEGACGDDDVRRENHFIFSVQALCKFGCFDPEAFGSGDMAMVSMNPDILRYAAGKRMHLRTSTRTI